MYLHPLSRKNMSSSKNCFYEEVYCPHCNCGGNTRTYCRAYSSVALIWGQRLFESCTWQRIVLLIIFCIKLTVFSLWLYRAVALIWGQPFNNINFFLPTALLIWGLCLIGGNAYLRGTYGIPLHFRTVLHVNRSLSATKRSCPSIT